MMSYREKRQKKSRMASAINDLQGPVKEVEKLPSKEELNTTYEISDDSMSKFKSELKEIMDTVNKIPVSKDDKADHTILESSDEVLKEMRVLDDLIRNIEQWKDALIVNEALPINLLVSLTVSVSWLLRCKAELTTKVDNLVQKSAELTNTQLLKRNRELNKALLDKISENAELKVVEQENDKLKKVSRSHAIAQRFARFALKMKALKEKRRRHKASREGSSYSRYSSLTSRRTTPATANMMKPLFEGSAFPAKKESEPIESIVHEEEVMTRRGRGASMMHRRDMGAYSSFTAQLLDEEPYIWKASKNTKSHPNEDKGNTVFAHIPSEVIDNFKPQNYVLPPLQGDPEAGDEEEAARELLNRRESFVKDLNMTVNASKELPGELVCEGLHGLAEKQTYTRQEVLEARIKHAKQLHQLQDIFEQRIRSVNAYYQDIMSSQST